MGVLPLSSLASSRRLSCWRIHSPARLDGPLTAMCKGGSSAAVETWMIRVGDLLLCFVN